MTQTLDATGKPIIPGTAIETRLIVDLIRRKRAGDTLRYDEIEEAIKRSARPGTTGYGYLQSARRIAEREHGVILSSERLIGYRLCNDPQKLEVAGTHLGKARRAVKRSLKVLRATDYERLTDEQKREYNARASLAGAVQLMTKRSSVETVKDKVNGQPLPSSDVLRLFQK